MIIGINLHPWAYHLCTHFHLHAAYSIIHTLICTCMLHVWICSKTQWELWGGPLTVQRSKKRRGLWSSKADVPGWPSSGPVSHREWSAMIEGCGPCPGDDLSTPRGSAMIEGCGPCPGDDLSTPRGSALIEGCGPCPCSDPSPPRTEMSVGGSEGTYDLGTQPWLTTVIMLHLTVRSKCVSRWESAYQR